MRLATMFLLASGLVLAASASSSLTMGKADMKSAGVLAFGPDGVLFAGDPVGGSIFAIDTDDTHFASYRQIFALDTPYTIVYAYLSSAINNGFLQYKNTTNILFITSVEFQFVSRSRVAL